MPFMPRPLQKVPGLVPKSKSAKTPQFVKIRFQFNQQVRAQQFVTITPRIPEFWFGQQPVPLSRRLPQSLPKVDLTFSIAGIDLH
jgi:hypothetical protein